MNEWTVVSVLMTLVGLGAVVMKPLISLNTTISRLSVLINELDKNVSGLSQKNGEAHSRIWTKLYEQDRVLDRYEKRLMLMENAGGK